MQAIRTQMFDSNAKPDSFPRYWADNDENFG